MLLWRALEHFEPRLRLVQLQWEERLLLERRQLRLPPSVLIWWRIDGAIPVDSLDVLRESGRFGSGALVFDFDQEVDVPAFGWLGALKMEVLHRLVDVLLDQRPVEAVEAITEVLGEASGWLTSPVDLLDFGEALVETAAQGMPLSDSRAEACARVLAARFDLPRHWNKADSIARALVSLATAEEIPAEQQKILRQAGMVEKSGVPLPMADLLGQPEVLRRTLLRIASVHPLQAPLWEIAPTLFSRDAAGEKEVEKPVGLRLMPGGAEEQAQAPMPAGADKLVVEARRMLAQGNVDVFIQRMMKAQQRATRAQEPASEAELRADVLMAVANEWASSARQGAAGATDSQLASLQMATAEIYEQIGARGKAGEALVQAGARLLNDYRILDALKILERARLLLKPEKQKGILAFCLRCLGEAHSWLGHLSEAEATYERAHQLYVQLEDRLGEAHTLHTRGNLYTRMDRLTQAEQAYVRALQLYEQLEAPLSKAHTLRSLGDLYHRTDRLAQAEDAYTLSLHLCEQLEDQLGQANTLLALGHLYHRMDRLAQAEEAYARALRLYARVKDRLGEANTLRALGELHHRMDRLAQAEEAYARALPLYEQLEDRLGNANTLRALGDLHYRMDRLAQAEDAYARALQLYEQIVHRLGEAHTLHALGHLYIRMDRLEQAEEAYAGALQLYEQLKVPLGKANALRAMGNLHQRMDRLAQAEETYTHALQLYEQLEDRLGKANALHQIGELHQRMGRLAQAEEAYARALQLYEQVKDQLGEANTLQSLGSLHQRMDRLDQAEETYTHALQLYEQLEDRLGKANTLHSMGSLHQRMGRLDQAEEAYTHALQLYEQVKDRLGEANTLHSMGSLYHRMDRLDQAEEAYARALQLYDQLKSRLGEANTLRNKARLYLLSNNDQWMAMLSKSMHIAQEISDVHGYWLGRVLEAYYLLGIEPAKALETWTEAQRYFEQAGLALEAKVTQALILLAKGETPERAASLLGPSVFGLKKASTLDREALVRVILSLFPAS
jgi:tetratricopeptide (TPR) repeat protein